MPSSKTIFTLPLSEASFLILLSLVGGPRHGYAVLKDVEEASGGRVTLSVSTLYTTLGRMQEQGWIERHDIGASDPTPGLPRKVYRLTEQGQKALGLEAQRMNGLLSVYRLRLGEERP
jgi:PadR family transcriptional regulator, regulatory protein PadR